MNSVAFVVLTLAALSNAGVIAPAYAPLAPLGYSHGFAPAVVAHAPVVTKVAAPIAYAAPHPVAYAAPIAPIVKTHAVVYTAPLIAKAAVPAFAHPVAYGHAGPAFAAPAYAYGGAAYAAPGLHYL